MDQPEFFRNVLAPAQAHPRPPAAFHIGGMRLFHFTSATALDTVFTLLLLFAVLIAVVIAWARRNSDLPADE